MTRITMPIMSSLLNSNRVNGVSDIGWKDTYTAPEKHAILRFWNKVNYRHHGKNGYVPKRCGIDEPEYPHRRMKKVT